MWKDGDGSLKSVIKIQKKREGQNWIGTYVCRH